MDAATASGPGNSLAWRALGMMTYAYSGDVDGAQSSLAKVTVVLCLMLHLIHFILHIRHDS